jgi:hypothetical protein
MTIRLSLDRHFSSYYIYYAVHSLDFLRVCAKEFWRPPAPAAWWLCLNVNRPRGRLLEADSVSNWQIGPQSPSNRLTIGEFVDRR